jgi:hypothetical protein
LDFAGDACVAAGSAAGCCADWTGTDDVADEESEEQAGEKGDMHFVRESLHSEWYDLTISNGNLMDVRLILDV